MVDEIRSLLGLMQARILEALSEIPDVEYDVAITMGCGDECPFVRAKRREDWGIPDPKEMPAEEFRRVRDQIEQKVRALLAGSSS